ncbi:MAG: hypothetical protein ACLPTJ_21000 [Solirubrobacteraceae bacterium]
MPNLHSKLLRPGRLALIAAGLICAVAAAMPAAAAANSSQITILQDNSDLSNPAAALAQFRELGANTVRVVIAWSQLAPSPNAKKKPSFNATDPSAYSAANWAPYDAIVREASVYGLTVDFTVTGGAPRWAEGGNPPQSDPFFAWRPNTEAFGQFVQAVGARYSGHFTPPGASSPLPAVHFWAIYNEPNFGEDLGPQASNDSTVATGPAMFRGLLNAGWSALQKTGHGHNTILWGELAAEGYEPGRFPKQTGGLPGSYGQTRPLLFLRDLYCVNSSFQQLRGGAAKAIGCPTNAAGSRRFRGQNPALFNATGVSDHPYPQGESPASSAGNKVDFARFNDLGNLAHELDRLTHVYSSGKHFAIYNTEYGYITRPPKGAPYPSPATAAYFINWAEYLSYKNPRVKSYMQYLLTDPPPNAGAYAGFASGLETYKGAKKATFYAFRMPVYMPRTSFSRNQSVEVWGDVRPAPFATLDGFGSQHALIQLQSQGAWRTISTVTVARATGYFDVRIKFPSSGTVRIAWTYPSTDSLLTIPDVQAQTIYSRTFTVKVS